MSNRRGEVERLVEGALVDRAIAEVAEAAAFAAEVFEAVGEAEAERGLAGDDAVAAPEVLVRREEVHRAALAFRAAGLFAEHFRHALVHAHADGEGVAVVAVGGDEVVIRPAERDGADGDGFLADVEVEEAADFAALVVFQAGLLEAADADHLGKQLDFPLRGERLVDGRVGEIEGGRVGAGHGRRWKVSEIGQDGTGGSFRVSADLGKAGTGAAEWSFGRLRREARKMPVKSTLAAARLRRKTHEGDVAAERAGPEGLTEAGEGFCVDADRRARRHRR